MYFICISVIDDVMQVHYWIAFTHFITAQFTD